MNPVLQNRIILAHCRIAAYWVTVEFSKRLPIRYVWLPGVQPAGIHLCHLITCPGIQWRQPRKVPNALDTRQIKHHGGCTRNKGPHARMREVEPDTATWGSSGEGTEDVIMRLNKIDSEGLGCSLEVEGLCSKCKAMGSTPSTNKQKTKLSKKLFFSFSFPCLSKFWDRLGQGMH